MSENTDESGKKTRNDDTGFQINLPFGMGWLRGDGSHLSLLLPALMPVIRWLVFSSAVIYLVIRVIQESR